MGPTNLAFFTQQQPPFWKDCVGKPPFFKKSNLSCTNETNAWFLKQSPWTRGNKNIKGKPQVKTVRGFCFFLAVWSERARLVHEWDPSSAVRGGLGCVLCRVILEGRWQGEGEGGIGNMDGNFLHLFRLGEREWCWRVKRGCFIYRSV